MFKKFTLSSEDCETLLAFENVSSLMELAQLLQRDHSVIARQLKRISEKHPVVEKKAGKWQLTESGKRLNESTRFAIDTQAACLKTVMSVRIGSTREFAARILGPQIHELQAIFAQAKIEIYAFEKGVEEALLAGQVDFGIDCDRPMDPEIAFKQMVDEPILAVASKDFIRKNRKTLADGKYHELPHLLCDRLSPDRILQKPESSFRFASKFNDIATTRAACLQGAGWALLPRYAVRDELATKTLLPLSSKTFGHSRYGVWQLRRRAHLQDQAKKLGEWLRLQKL